MKKYGGELDLRKIFRLFSWNTLGKISTRKQHLPQHYFTGSNTRAEKGGVRLDENDNPRPESIPFNRIDEAAIET